MYWLDCFRKTGTSRYVAEKKNKFFDANKTCRPLNDEKKEKLSKFKNTFIVQKKLR